MPEGARNRRGGVHAVGKYADKFKERGEMDTAAVKRGQGGRGLYEEGGRVGIGTGREGTKGEQRHWSTGERAGGIRSQECSTETQQEGREGVRRQLGGGKEVKGVGKKVEE